MALPNPRNKDAILLEANAPLTRRVICYDAEKMTVEQAFEEVHSDFKRGGLLRRIVYETHPIVHYLGNGMGVHQFTVEMNLPKKEEKDT